MNAEIDTFLSREALPADYRRLIDEVHRPLAARIAAQVRRSGPGFLLAVCGPQGSGKTTMAQVLQHLSSEVGMAAVVLSLDDFYLSRAERRALAKQVHPLLITRGVPGTHDIQLALSALKSLTEHATSRIPLFDKATDDRRSEHEWREVKGPIDVIIFEGWCVGALPESERALERPINQLEAAHDVHGSWRRYVNARLASDYQQLFSQIDALVFLQPPNFDVVYQWRLEQEEKLRARTPEGRDIAIMGREELRVFISHYERLTRHLLAEMPHRADLVIQFDAERRPQALHFNSSVCDWRAARTSLAERSSPSDESISKCVA